MVLIETFLLDKLEKAMKNVESSIGSTHLGPEKARDPSESLMTKIPPEPRPALEPKIKENLYSLNNQALDFINHPGLNLVARREVKHIKENFERTKTEIFKQLNSSSVNSDPKVNWWSSRLPNPTVEVFGFEDRVIERLLVRNEKLSGGLKVVGLIGLAGVGKTTLCQMGFTNPKVENHFFPRIWACLSAQPDMEGPNGNYQEVVVKRILAGLGFEDKVLDKIGDEGHVRRLLFALRQQLKGRKYLIVLDDLSNSGEERFFSLKNREVDKSKLSYGLPRGDGGAAVVTSRSRKLAENVVGEKNTHEILPLEDKNKCWDIFVKEVLKDEVYLPENFEGLKDPVVRKCAGLPSAAKIMGKIVREKLRRVPAGDHDRQEE